MMLALLANPFVKWFGIASSATIVLLVISLFITRGTLHNLRQANKLAEATRAREKAETEARWERRLSDERGQYAADNANRQPIIILSKDTVTRYAQTLAGKLPCLDADRVRGIDSFDTDIAVPTTRSGATVPDTASTAPE